MISEEPDEDADTLDDESVLETYLGSDALTREAVAGRSTSLQDWPPSHERELGLDLNAETVAWFKANHVDWRLAMASTLRAWVAARTQTRSAAQAAGLITD
jgi:hypothetical protein